jgi:hypothetical protein
MQITSTAIGGSTHFLSDAAHAEQAQHDATNSSPESIMLRQGIIIIGGAPATGDKGKGVGGPTENISLNFGQVSLAYAQQKANGTGANPQPLATTSNSLANLHPAGGLHSIAGGQVSTTARDLNINPGLGAAAEAFQNANGHVGGESEGGGVFGPLRALRDQLGGGGGPKPA